jgi:hypothetical protein
MGLFDIVSISSQLEQGQDDLLKKLDELLWELRRIAKNQESPNMHLTFTPISETEGVIRGVKEELHETNV